MTRREGFPQRTTHCKVHFNRYSIYFPLHSTRCKILVRYSYKCSIQPCIQASLKQHGKKWVKIVYLSRDLEIQISHGSFHRSHGSGDLEIYGSVELSMGSVETSMGRLDFKISRSMELSMGSVETSMEYLDSRSLDPWNFPWGRWKLPWNIQILKSGYPMEVSTDPMESSTDPEILNQHFAANDLKN